MRHLSNAFQTLLTITLFSCSQSVENTLPQLKVESDTFKISAGNDTTLVGKKGTRIFIEANSFESSSEKIEITLKECYEISDMIIEGLSTHAGDRILGSNGMINLRAFADSTELSLRDGKKLVIQFPKKIDNPSMTIFYGDTSTGEMNWTADSSQMLWPRIAASITVTEDLHQNMEEFLKDTFSILQCYKERPSPYIVRRLKEINFYRYRVYKSEDYKIDSIAVACKIHNNRDSLIRDLLKRSLDTLIVPIWKEHESRECFLWFRFNDMDHLSNEQFLKSFESMYGDRLQNLEEGDLDFYIFSTAKLGWINTDFFIDYPQGRSDLTVQGQPKDAVTMILKNSRSYLSSQPTISGYQFKGVPVGVEATLLGIRTSQGRPSIFIEEILTESSQMIEPVYKELANMEELEKIIRQLN